MKKILLLNITVAFLVSTLTLPLNARGEELTYKVVEEKVIKADNRCTECHGKEKDEPPLNYKWIRRALKGMTEEDIRNDAWFPISYCNGPLEDARKEIILKWVKAGMPE
jgi:hypothetical protein